MGALDSPEMHAGTRLRECKGELAEVTGDESVQEVRAPLPTPAHEILLGDEDAPVARLSAAGAARQAVELCG